MDQMRRRQSILKNDGEATPTKTFGKNKRISFSGKNSVKEFLEDNEKLTVWGTSYEKEMEAMQKAGDSTAPSQMDISGATSLCDKENIGPSKANPPRISFALLDDEDSQVRNANHTMLHALPQENLSHENIDQYGQLFQLKSFLGAPSKMPSTTINDEVSMMWDDIMSHTKEAVAVGNKMGNTMNLISDPESTAEGTRRGTVLRSRETIYEAQMDMSSKSVIVPRRGQEMVNLRENTVTAKTKAPQTVNYDYKEGNMEQAISAEECQLDTSIELDKVAKRPRDTIHFAGQNDDMDVSRRTPLHHEDVSCRPEAPRPPVRHRQTIHFQAEDGQMDETIAAEQKPPLMVAKQSRQTIVFQDENAALDESIQISGKSVIIERGHLQQPQLATRAPRQTIIFNADMDESLRCPPPVQQQKGYNNPRQTIHFTANDGEMDESLQIKLPQPTTANCQTNLPKPTATRQTIYFAADMDESLRCPPPVQQQQCQKGYKNPRQTIHFTANEGEMDESLQIMKFPQPTANCQTNLPKPTATRQTIYAATDMDESLRCPPPVQQQQCQKGYKNPRQTIHFTANDGEMDESLQIKLPQPTTTNCQTNLPKPTATRQTIHFNPNNGQMEESLHMQSLYFGADGGQMDESAVQYEKPIEPKRQTIHFRADDANMNMSVCPPINKHRQTIVFHPDEGQMDESFNYPPPPPPITHHSQPTTTTRQTIHFPPESAQMDESVAQPSKHPRQSIYFGAGMDGQMDESVVPVTSSSRQTIHFRAGEGHMDQSQVPVDCDMMMDVEEEEQQPLKTPGKRGTVHLHRDMDESCVGGGFVAPPPLPPSLPPSAPSQVKRQRHTVYYHDQNGDLDVSSAAAPPPVIQSTIHSGAEEEEGEGEVDDEMGMEMSLMVFPPKTNTPVQSANRTIIHDKSMDESIALPREQLMGPLKMALLARANNSLVGVAAPNRTVQEMLEMSVHETSRRRPRETVYTVAAMEESMVRPEPPVMRRETFNVEHHHHHHHRPMTNSTACDLNDTEDSIELLDSQDRGRRPMSRANMSQRMSLASPLVPDETVNELILSYNMTGQFVGQRVEEEEEGETVEEKEQTLPLTVAKGMSRIPVAKVVRTPRKVEPRLDLSAVDTVSRDAAPVVMGRSTFGLAASEVTFIDGGGGGGGGGKGQQKGVSIPEFVEEGNWTRRHTMLEMEELPEGEEEEEDGVKGMAKDRDYRQLDVHLMETVDFEKGRQQLKMLRYTVDKVANTTPVEQSMYLNRTSVEDKGLREAILREIKEKTEQGLTDIDDGIDWGCFPLCLPMEEMIKNLVESEHKRWRYQDLYYFVGLLKFTHRLVKTFQVVIGFELGDAEFEREHYLPFHKYTVVEQDLGKWSDVDRRMHKELMRQLPVGLVSLYGSSNDLGRFLSDVDRICCRIFREMAVVE